ncbi:MAG: hypothetical protein K6F53_02875, partial [Lachnospiraceae bacterium]|nr:hypothetical protein [Lachnospiraceae bacterium]
KGGATYPEKTSELIAKYLKDKGFDGLSYNVFAFTGVKDIAYPALDAQIRAMLSDGFNKGPDKVLKYDAWEEGTHCYEYIYEYIYNILAEVL